MEVVLDMKLPSGPRYKSPVIPDLVNREYRESSKRYSNTVTCPSCERQNYVIGYFIACGNCGYRFNPEAMRMEVPIEYLPPLPF